MRMRMATCIALATLVAGAGELLAGAPGFGPRRPPRGGPDTSFFKSVPAPKDDAEKKILAVLQDMFEQQRRGMQNVPMEDGRLLRVLTEMCDAKHVVEIGTSNGYSGIWMCLGLMTTDGRLTTHDIDEGRARLARENFKRAGVAERVTLVMGDAHDTVKQLKGPIDILFLDADKAGYKDYLDKLLPLVRPGGLIIGHNAVSMKRQMQEFLDAVTSNPELETFYVNPRGTGMSVTLKKRKPAGK
jgi:caffeoyl-CoA O-methyltransferase